jgi:hypothetical protein
MLIDELLAAREVDDPIARLTDRDRSAIRNVRHKLDLLRDADESSGVQSR